MCFKVTNHGLGFIAFSWRASREPFHSFRYFECDWNLEMRYVSQPDYPSNYQFQLSLKFAGMLTNPVFLNASVFASYGKKFECGILDTEMKTWNSSPFPLHRCTEMRIFGELRFDPYTLSNTTLVGLKDAATQASIEEYIEDLKSNSNSDCKCSSLANDLQAARSDSYLTDVRLRVAEQEIPAHRLILGSRSSVFKAMFEHDMKENRDQVVDLVNMEASTAKELLHYLYTGKLQDLNEGSAMKLYATGDQYDVQELKETCQCFMLSNVSVDNVCVIAILADLHSDEVLLQAVKSFLKSNNNLTAVMNTDQWKVAKESKPEFFFQLLETVCLEMTRKD